MLSISLQITPAWSQLLVSGPYDHEFYSLGIDTNGIVIILGGQNGDAAALYELKGTNFHITPLQYLSQHAHVESAKMSRDGQYIAADTLPGDLAVPTLWTRFQPDTPIYPDPLPGDDAHTTDVASTDEGPLVTIRGSPSSFIWTLSGGLRPWLVNDQYSSRLWLQCTSRNGKQYGGYELVLSGRTTGNVRAVAGTETNFTYLSPAKSTNSRVMAISPNGRFFGGYDDLHATVWHDGKTKRLPFGKNVSSFCHHVTDNGFASGIGAGHLIYDPRSRKAYPFATWWSKRYPRWPLPGLVRSIEDLYEHEGNLYCLLSVRDDEAGENFSVLAVAPIKGLPLAYFKSPKSKGGRFGGIPGWRASK